MLGNPHRCVLQHLKPFSQRSMLMTEPTRRHVQQPSNDADGQQQPDRIADYEASVLT